MRSIRHLPAILACLAWSGATAAPPPVSLSVRDGAWLQNGVKLQQRWLAHETLSDEDLSEAKTVKAYVCAVLDLEKYLVERATTLSRALHEGKRKKQHLDPQMLDGMSRALPLVIPLMKTPFLEDSPSCDKAVVIVREYLEKYPEMLPKDAHEIVEKALLDAYSNSDAS
jgi:hypothetical protein